MIRSVSCKPMRRLFKTTIIFCLPLCLFISGCSQTAYYLQAAQGQLSLLNKRTPVEKLLQDPQTAPELRQQLNKANAMRQFAVEKLQLEKFRGFTTYADVQRRYVTWNVVAAPRYSLQPETWCFPIAGCVSYKGYFKKSAAEALEAELVAEGKDTLVYGVAAYSTLGWFDDPILNTFIHYRDHELAALIFHELAHQLAYVKDDSDFNEAFATAVETVLLEQWLKQQGDQALIDALTQQQRKQDRITGLILDYRERLREAYTGDNAETAKPQIFAELQQQYRQLKEAGQGTRYYDWWFSRELDNADLLTVSTYYQLVPGFLALYEQDNRDLDRFIERIRQMAQLEREQRRALLDAN